MGKISLGLLGAGNISDRVANGVFNSRNAVGVQVASRSLERSRKLAQKYSFANYSEGYDSLFADDVDAVYITTIDRLHYEHIKMCLEAGKHVICEKPMLDSIEKLDELYELANKKNLVLMEAMKDLYIPTISYVEEYLAMQEEDLLYAFVPFSRYHDDPRDSFLFDPIHGGALRDVGSYSLSWALHFLGDNIQKVDFDIKTDETGTDISTNVNLLFKDGKIANILAALNTHWITWRFLPEGIFKLRQGITGKPVILKYIKTQSLCRRKRRPTKVNSLSK